jgi:hypothetical protein
VLQFLLLVGFAIYINNAITRQLGELFHQKTHRNNCMYNSISSYDIFNARIVDACRRRVCVLFKRHLEWNYDEHSFVVKSTQCKRPVANGLPLPSGYSPPVVALAAFDVWPLRFTGLIEVYREVLVILSS